MIYSAIPKVSLPPFWRPAEPAAHEALPVNVTPATEFAPVPTIVSLNVQSAVSGTEVAAPGGGPEPSAQPPVLE